MVLIGAGQGLAFAPMNFAGLAATGPADAGAASGLIKTFHQLGSALGPAVLAAIGSAAVPDGTVGTTSLVDRVKAALTGSASCSPSPWRSSSASSRPAGGVRAPPKKRGPVSPGTRIHQCLSCVIPRRLQQ
jgi:hypothetical protein